MGDLSLGDKNFSDAGTELFIDDAPFDSNYMLWVDAMLVVNKDVIGVIGIGGNGGTGVWAESQTVGGGTVNVGSGAGVFAKGRLGVRAIGTEIGVLASCGPVGRAAVSAVADPNGSGMGLYGRADQQSAVVGDNRFTQQPVTAGCLGLTHDGFGTVGVVAFDRSRKPSSGNAALLGVVEFDPSRPMNDTVTALLADAAFGGKGNMPQGFAGIFNGPVAINGELTVFGKNYKSAAVEHPDGSYRRLHSLEAPESLFEDVGRARLTRGQADVRLDPDFAALVVTKNYHVFLTAEGNCAGLYVAKRTPEGFLVQESARGTSNIAFSYRIVAQRADVPHRRLERVERPTARAGRFPIPPEPPMADPSPPPPRPKAGAARTRGKSGG
jgi:hypothetical protein